ncbi:MAG: beta-ketoacyl synthase chain length factor [Candidatus Binataceae bacterium]
MACGPNVEPRKAWIARLHGVTNPQRDTARAEVNLAPILRRRISKIGQLAFSACYSLPEQRTARFVFCSRHGELDRTLRILRSLAAGEPISPADFALSVHNALVGLLSIAWGNTAGHTAIAAGADSFAYGLVEAVAGLEMGAADSVMLVNFDDLLPPPYDEVGDGVETCVALAMLLEPARNDGHDFALELEPRDGALRPPSASAQALDFISFMLSGEREASSIGERVQWRWRRCA